MVTSISIRQLITIQQEFMHWAVAGDENKGKHHNCLEAFL